MSFQFSKVVEKDFEQTITILSDELKKEKFGILTEINLQDTFKNKIGEDFRKFKIFGACNPGEAFKILSHNRYAGVFLPCNFVVQETEEGFTEVSFINPSVSLNNLENKEISEIGERVTVALKRVLENL